MLLAVLILPVASKMASQELSRGEVALSGAISRVIAQTMLHPLDVIRTRTQTYARLEPRAGAVLYGLAPQMALSGPAGALQFCATDACRRQIEARAPTLRESSSGRAAVQLVAAAFGTAVAASIRVPQEILKQGCMAELYPNAFRAFWDIVAARGLGGLYRGARETIIRDVLWNSVSFALFRFLSERAPDKPYANGILAGSIAAILTHPLDVLKTRIMTSGGPDSGAAGTLLSQLGRLVANEGPGVLCKGILPRLLYLGPLASMVLATNELVAAWILQIKKTQQQQQQQQQPPQYNSDLVRHHHHPPEYRYFEEVAALGPEEKKNRGPTTTTTTTPRITTAPAAASS